MCNITKMIQTVEINKLTLAETESGCYDIDSGFRVESCTHDREIGKGLINPIAPLERVLHICKIA